MIKPNNRAFGAKGKQANRASPVEMHPFCLRHLPRRGRSALRFLVESCGTMLSTHSPTSEAGGKVVASATKGGRRRQAAYKMAPQGTVPPQSVSRLKGRPLIGQARGQLRLTCVSHAGYAQSGTIYLPWAEPSNRPEGEADPGQNPWRPGPQARRRHQPSRRSRVNLREYSQAPPSLPKAPHLKYRTQQRSTNLSTSASFLISSLFLPAIPAKTAQVP